MFNKYFFKDSGFWLGALLIFWDRSVVTRIEVTNFLWIMYAIFFVTGVYFVVRSVWITKDK